MSGSCLDGVALSATAIAGVVIGTVAFEYVLSTTSSLLNYWRLQESKIPVEMEGVYDADDYAKSQLYTRDKTAYGLCYHTFDVLTFASFWALGGFQAVDVLVQSIAPSSLLMQGLAYIGTIVVGSSVLSLPWSIYSTFVLEEKHGFNRTTCKTFVTDMIKATGLGVVIGTPLLAAFLWFFLKTSHAWFYCFATLASAQLLIMLIAPTYIMPLFLSFTPLPEGELRTAIEKYATHVGFSFGNIYEIDGKTRSAHSNAFFTGFGSSKRIALYDTLIKQCTVDEMVAVVAHEVGHEKSHHQIRSAAFVMSYLFFVFYALGVVISYPPLFAAFGVERVSVHVGLVIAQLLFQPVDTFLQVVLNVRSRANEFEADRYSVDTYREPEVLATALKKLCKQNLSNLTPHPLLVFLEYTHPPILERVAAIRAHADKGGITGNLSKPKRAGRPPSPGRAKSSPARARPARSASPAASRSGKKAPEMI